MKTKIWIVTTVTLFLIFVSHTGLAQTIALWLFDEQVEIYPSSVLNDQSNNDYPLVIGPGGKIVPGKFGNALEPIEQPPIVIPEGELLFGLQSLPIPDGRTVEPMTWKNANFCALMTSGENHLRKDVNFAKPTRTKLNLGDFDWTVEFWFKSTGATGDDGVVFEIGQGPRGENDFITQLLLNKDMKSFKLINQPTRTNLPIPSNPSALNPISEHWHHFAFVYSSKKNQLTHYVDGKKQGNSLECQLKALKEGDEDYMNIGRDGLWKRPLQGKIDELHFIAGQAYTKNFRPPKSYSPIYNGTHKPVALKKGPPLLFGPLADSATPIQLDDRKHLFIDDALIEKSESITFTVNPPRLEERVIENIVGPYRKHLTLIEDEKGLLRMYNSVNDDYLQIMTSPDGIHWDKPDLGKAYRGHRNIVIHEPVGGLGNPFIDPNGPAEHRWKYITGYNNRGIFLYTSPDGWNWKRHKTYVLPFRSGTQACTFYDDQRQLYIGYHRTGFARTPAGATQRESVLAEVSDLFKPWPFKRVSQQETWEASKTYRYRDPQPWYLDNGPLTPGGISLDLPRKFTPIDTLDPVGTDIYITKAIKYPWASDTYFAFPITYFHYEKDGPITRQILMDPARKRGSGPVETQIAVSRDGVNWKRYARPAYVGIGTFGGWDIHQSYLAHGMVERNQEIWQYVFGLNEYHSTYVDKDEERGVFRLVQRIDGFISVDTPYDKVGYFITKPFIFKGNRLILNIDTDAAGYAQVGFLNEQGKPIAGFTVDDCVYINGDFIAAEVEWIKNSDAITIPRGKSIEDVLPEVKKLKMSKDVSALQEKTVQLVFRMRGAKLYSMQFVEEK